MQDKRFSKRRTQLKAGTRIAEAILDFVGQAPFSTELPAANPELRARALAATAARRAALTTSGLSLPPGPLGWLTLLPELRSLWQLQTQLVADIAACHGKTAELGREEMIYCLFRHTDAQAVRDLVAQIGQRFVVQRASRPQVQAVVLKIGMHIAQRLIGKGISRWIPVFGALGAGAYAYYDTSQVSDTAIEFFAGVIDVHADEAEPDVGDSRR
ncbi:MAG: hypothetical protein AW11_00295 [Candidatus Accumulibacter regalis]|jgi:hypothetical protein|uniref:Uncharacterized protein n=1 Tax=Accumulibacter regalis TaxID=522306 RepID=A0A011RID4_ACCRE|nr:MULTISPECIES: hypothetical protein [unclassified Candidatus Accumulibacter]EXI90954.1 MAG: hypothetical protein AW11_00295 [Candidatus Accumulibacter regalis]MQM33567.1 hypothetical protein [Candidatus Accumulibacter phosphatis]MBL8367935.1 hypothetical protein [Accumulibacter sp.]MBN8513862.1 hypothetical protein [Accumulibacter sp.]MBO3701425.1 hypothetical protein [Accumulibacter sp.]